MDDRVILPPEVLRIIRANEMTRLLPIVILTSSPVERNPIQGCRPGASSYIRKPADFRKLMEAVKLLGLYWLSWNNPASDRPEKFVVRISGEKGVKKET